MRVHFDGGQTTCRPQTLAHSFCLDVNDVKFHASLCTSSCVMMMMDDGGRDDDSFETLLTPAADGHLLSWIAQMRSRRNSQKRSGKKGVDD
jgi:hypothetical protein